MSAARAPILFAAGWAASLVALSTPARAADPAQLAAAQSLYERAHALVGAGRFQEACPVFEEALGIEPRGTGIMTELADCYEKTGRYASAWAMYTRGENVARLADNPVRAGQAARGAQALAPRLSTLAILVPDAARRLPGLEIKRDDEVIGAPQWGLAVPVDGGSHTVVATATGKVPWQATIRIAPDHDRAEVAVGAMADLPAAAAAPPAAPLRTAPLPSIVPGAPPPPTRSVPAWAWITGGVGLALAGVAAGFAIASEDVAVRQRMKCGEDLQGCKLPYDPSADNTLKFTYYGLFLGFTAAGAAAVGTSIYGIAAAPRAPAKPSATLAPAPWMAPGGGGVALTGSF